MSLPTATGHGGESQNSNCLPLAMRRYSTLCIRPQAGVFRASHPRSFFTCPSRRHNFICDNSHRSTMTLAFVQIPIVKINCENVQRPLNLKHMKPGLWWIKKINHVDTGLLAALFTARKCAVVSLMHGELIRRRFYTDTAAPARRGA